MTTLARGPAAVLAVAAALFFVGLDAYDLDTKGEPREGVTAWEMIHTGDWMLPRLNAELLPEKPPVFPWLVALSTLALGEGGELAPRLPSAIAGCGLVLVVFFLGRRLQGDGVRPAVVCASMALVIGLARRARVDMTLTFFVTLALLQFLRALERPRATTIGFFWAALAAATLTKGPMGALLPLLAGGTHLLLRGRLREARLFLPMAWVLVLGGGWWYAAGLLREGDAFGYRSFMKDNFLMFFGARGGGEHVHGTLYFVPYVPLHTAPWCLYLPVALWYAWQRRDEDASRFPLAWLGSFFVFFSLARGKRPDYLLPLMPAFALVIARLWREGETRWLRDSSVLGAVAGVLGLIALPFAGRRIPFELPPLLVAGAACVTVSPSLLLALGRRRAAFAAIAGGMVLIASSVAVSVMPRVQSTRSFVEDVARIASTAPLVQRGVIDYTTVYYLGRRIPTVERAELERTLATGGFAIVSHAEWRSLPAPLRDQVAAVASDRILVGRTRP
ncbi:MAG: ArnT family glycosyltransferase [Planctomycetota bacterium]